MRSELLGQYQPVKRKQALGRMEDWRQQDPPRHSKKRTTAGCSSEPDHLFPRGWTLRSGRNEAASGVGPIRRKATKTGDDVRRCSGLAAALRAGHLKRPSGRPHFSGNIDDRLGLAILALPHRQNSTQARSEVRLCRTLWKLLLAMKPFLFLALLSLSSCQSFPQICQHCWVANNSLAANS